MRLVWIVAVFATCLFVWPSSEVRAAQDQDDLSLRESQTLLEASNRALRLALRQQEGSSADIRRADVGPNPSLSLAWSNARPRRYGLPDSDWIVRLEQLLERGGKRELRVAAARDLHRAAGLDIRETLRQQKTLLAIAYFDLVAAQATHELAQETTEAYRRLLAAAERRLQAGDIASVDVSRLRVEEGRARNDARTAQAGVEQSQIALAILLGDETRARRLRASDPFLDLSLPAPDAVDLEAALEHRPDVAALKARLDALAQTRRLALAQTTRDVLVGVQTERSPSLGGQIFGVSLSFPLFINNDFSGDLARADADLALAAEDLDRLRAQVRSEVARAQSLTTSALERALRLERQSLPQANRAAQAIEFAFSRGAATLTDLFDAKRQLTAVRLEALAARADHSKALLAWRAAVHQEDRTR